MSFLAAGVLILITIFRVMLPSTLPRDPQKSSPYKQPSPFRKKEWEETFDPQENDIDLWKKSDDSWEPPAHQTPIHPSKKQSTVGGNFPPTPQKHTERPAMAAYRKLLEKAKSPQISLASSRTRIQKIKNAPSLKIKKQTVQPLSITLPIGLQNHRELQKALIYVEIFSRKHF